MCAKYFWLIGRYFKDVNRVCMSYKEFGVLFSAPTILISCKTLAPENANCNFSSGNVFIFASSHIVQ